MPEPEASPARNYNQNWFATIQSAACATFLREHAVPIFLVLLFAAASLVRLWGMSKLHFWDEMVYLQDAQVICCGKINYSELDFRPPLLSVIFAGVFLLWHSIYAACIATALINALGPVFLFLAGRLAVGRLSAAIASVLLAFSPFFVGVFPSNFLSDDTGNSLLTDSPALTLLILALWLLLRAMNRPAGLRFFGAGLVLSLCILMRFGSIPAVGILFLLCFAGRNRWKATLACASGLTAGLAPYLLWSRLTFGEFLFTLRSGWAHVEGPVPSPLFYLQNATASFTLVTIIGVVLSLLPRLPLPTSTNAPKLHDTPTGLFSTHSRNVIRSYLWFWLLSGFLFFSSMPHKEPRYILPLAPPVLLLAGSGLARFSALPSKSLRMAGGLLLGAALFLSFLPLRQRFSVPFLDRTVPDEELAAHFLATHVAPGTSLYMSFDYPIFAFYTELPIHELSTTGDALYRDMDQMPPGEVLIVYREAETASQSDVAWVNANPNFKRLRDLPSLVIFQRN